MRIEFAGEVSNDFVPFGFAISNGGRRGPFKCQTCVRVRHELWRLSNYVYQQFVKDVASVGELRAIPLT